MGLIKLRWTEKESRSLSIAMIQEQFPKSICIFALAIFFVQCHNGNIPGNKTAIVEERENLHDNLNLVISQPSEHDRSRQPNHSGNSKRRRLTRSKIQCSNYKTEFDCDNFFSCRCDNACFETFFFKRFLKVLVWKTDKFGSKPTQNK